MARKRNLSGSRSGCLISPDKMKEADKEIKNKYHYDFTIDFEPDNVTVYGVKVKVWKNDNWFKIIDLASYKHTNKDMFIRRVKRRSGVEFPVKIEVFLIRP